MTQNRIAGLASRHIGHSVPAARLLLNVRLLEATARSSRDLARDGVLKHRREAVALRRMMATHIADISAAARELADPDERRKVLGETAKLRAVTAHHQASWPIVAISLKDVEYRKSLTLVRSIYDAYFRWIEESYGDGEVPIR